jgi:hypothetical protein
MKINVVITYRNEGDNAYLPLMDMAIQNIKGWDYQPIIVGDIIRPDAKHIFFYNSSPLMVWILEAQLEYLKSPEFDCDSVFFSPDALIIKPIHDKFTGFDLAVTLKEQQKGIFALNNGVIFVSPKNKYWLIALWEHALWRCNNYRDELKEWGGDQKALQDTLEICDYKPEYLEVKRFDCADFNAPVSKYDPIIDRNILAQAHIVHFKGPRKLKMTQIWNEIKGKIYG